jgi:multimeric flavodoxin WrbA
MKILAICGSPRKGNTYSALKTVRSNFPEIDFEIIQMKELKISMCTGCYSCVTRGEEKCPLKDDKEMLLEKIHSADGLIVASPVYSHMVTGLIKNLFDRLGYFAHRPKFFDKYAMSVVTASGYGGKHATEYLNKMLKIYGFNMTPPVELQYKPGKQEENQTVLNNQKLVSAFEALVAKIKADVRDKPTLDRLIPFGIFKAIAETAKESMPADYQYYKDKEEYYYDVNIPFFLKFIAKKVVKKEVAKIL